MTVIQTLTIPTTTTRLTLSFWPATSKPGCSCNGDALQNGQGDVNTTYGNGDQNERASVTAPGATTNYSYDITGLSASSTAGSTTYFTRTPDARS